MAFINCELTEQDKDKLALLNLKNPLFPKKQLELNKLSYQTFDKEQDARLLIIRPEIIWPMVAIFLWKENVCEIYAHDTEDYEIDEINLKAIITLKWKIDKINIPECLKNQKDELLELIKESLIVRGKKIHCLEDIESKYFPFSVQCNTVFEGKLELIFY